MQKRVSAAITAILAEPEQPEDGHYLFTDMLLSPDDHFETWEEQKDYLLLALGNSVSLAALLVNAMAAQKEIPALTLWQKIIPLLPVLPDSE